MRCLNAAGLFEAVGIIWFYSQIAVLSWQFEELSRGVNVRRSEQWSRVARNYRKFPPPAPPCRDRSDKRNANMTLLRRPIVLCAIFRELLYPPVYRLLSHTFCKLEDANTSVAVTTGTVCTVTLLNITVILD